MLVGDHRLAPPRLLYPVFHGSFDWHSCVHAHWMLARLLRCAPLLAAAPSIAALFDQRFTAPRVAEELAILARPESRGFERTYGWAWLLALCTEISASPHSRSPMWRAALQPLAQHFAGLLVDYLPRAQYPVRHGTHVNSAFALGFAIDYARAIGDAALEVLAADKARLWFLDDRDAPGAWEPSGIDFLSPCLVEADLMRRVLSTRDFAAWLAAFLPDLSNAVPAALFLPVSVSDRSDGHLVHLDGLNLSRAWCWRAIAAALPAADPRAHTCVRAAEAHLTAGLRGIASGHYAGDHWLATFAVMAMTLPAKAT